MSSYLKTSEKMPETEETCNGHPLFKACHGDCAHCSPNRKQRDDQNWDPTIRIPIAEAQYELERARRLLSQPNQPDDQPDQPEPIKLTVGDISFATKYRKKMQAEQDAVVAAIRAHPELKLVEGDRSIATKLELKRHGYIA